MLSYNTIILYNIEYKTCFKQHKCCPCGNSPHLATLMVKKHFLLCKQLLRMPRSINTS
ncbi:hypothetical protein Hanom_Chr07g00603981 [Helianthus anomalus]